MSMTQIEQGQMGLRTLEFKDATGAWAAPQSGPGISYLSYNGVPIDPATVTTQVTITQRQDHLSNPIDGYYDLAVDPAAVEALGPNSGFVAAGDTIAVAVSAMMSAGPVITDLEFQITSPPGGGGGGLPSIQV